MLKSTVAMTVPPAAMLVVIAIPAVKTLMIFFDYIDDASHEDILVL